MKLDITHLDNEVPMLLRAIDGETVEITIDDVQIRLKLEHLVTLRELIKTED